MTVLLLTFFMLTSTFLQKEPTIVYTPSSVSEEKVPMNGRSQHEESKQKNGHVAHRGHVDEGALSFNFYFSHIYLQFCE